MEFLKTIFLIDFFLVFDSNWIFISAGVSSDLAQHSYLF